MKHLRNILLWSLCFLLLAGCTGEPTPTGTPTESPLSSPAAGITLETTRLSVEPWNSGRLANSAQFRSGETETGFYIAYMGMLYYGDKSDLSRWVPVCPNPDCDHMTSRNECKARMDAAFVLRDNRIYHLAPRRDGTMSQVPIFKTPVISMALDGSDGRLEYVVGGLETSVTAGSSTRTTMLTDRWCLEYTSFLNEEGAFDVKLVLLDETGNLDMLGVASDRILLLLRQGTGADRSATLCQILLNNDAPTLEILGALPLVYGD